MFSVAIGSLDRSTSTSVPTKSAIPAASGTVRSLQPTSFFPALNRNSFNFEIRIPRFGLILTSDSPVVNQATISAIPPLHTEYRLEKRVAFGATRTRKSLSSRLLGDITLETCTVKLMELRNIKIELVVVRRTESEVEIKATVVNQTTENNISVTWLVYPRPSEIGRDDLMGSIDLSRAPRTMRFRVPRLVLTTDHWLAISISKPFTTNAAMAAKIPS